MTAISMQALIISVLMLLACSGRNVFKRFEDGDFSVVVQGRYGGKTIFLNQGRQYKDLVDDLRHEIEKKRDFLPLITRKFFIVKGKLFYKFKFVAFDEGKKCLILRYFARAVDHPVYAGYQIQFVFDLKAKDFTEIYTAEVPYE